MGRLFDSVLGGGGGSMGDLVCVRILFFSKPLMIEFFPN